MARTFGGVSTDKVVSALTAHATQRSYHQWTYRTGAGGNSQGRLFEKTNGGAQVEVFLNSNAAVTYNYFRSWSGTDGNWSIPQPAVNEWHQIGASYDAGATTNDPLMYIDGVSQTVTQVTGDPTGSVDTNTDTYVFGNNGASTRNWAGRLCEFAVWNRILTAGEWAALGAGFSPLFFPDSLVEYIPLVREVISLKLAPPTATGTVVVEHPRIIYPTSFQDRRFTTAGAAAGGLTDWPKFQRRGFWGWDFS